MQIVIDIPEEDYKKINSEEKRIELSCNIAYEIANGIPLPKGHGELADIRPLMRGLYEEMCVGELTYTTSEVYKMLENEAPIIIEADNGESDEISDRNLKM